MTFSNKETRPDQAHGFSKIHNKVVIGVYLLEYLDKNNPPASLSAKVRAWKDGL